MQDEPEPSSQDIVRRLLYRDALMLVIDKPAGLAVHPDVKSGATLVDQLDALRFGLPRRPELAHRLDRDTSGCLVLGRHRKALARLGRLFAAGKVSKRYWAVVLGGPAGDEGEIALPLARRDPRGWQMRVDPAGQPALTRWRVMGRGEGMSFLALEPVTGRTHQLRVHCAAMGWPILGDRLYGPEPAPGLRLMLHARSVTVPLYPKRQAILADAPVPAEMMELLARCGWAGESGLSVQARL
ncbi:RluA family pseudouridine synthase [Chelatococcus sp. GCM10030263]|uniref:RluA family pseudouridine synthase n=1 Tax=Chelatococcus sp. GCM10030263 TaxID=3273387 RepID=UPI00361A3C91